MDRNVSISCCHEDLVADLCSFWLRTVFTSFVYFRLFPNTGCRWDLDDFICTCCCIVDFDSWENMCDEFFVRSCDSSCRGLTSDEDDYGGVFKSAGSLRGWHCDVDKGECGIGGDVSCFVCKSKQIVVRHLSSFNWYVEGGRYGCGFGENGLIDAVARTSAVWTYVIEAVTRTKAGWTDVIETSAGKRTVWCVYVGKTGDI